VARGHNIDGTATVIEKLGRVHADADHGYELWEAALECAIVLAAPAGGIGT
jgi:hypothetical protein